MKLNPHLLDLILTSSEDLEYHAGIGLSDHLVLSCTKNWLKEDTPRFSYNKGDYAAINDNFMDIKIHRYEYRRNVDILFKCTSKPNGEIYSKISTQKEQLTSDIDDKRNYSQT